MLELNKIYNIDVLEGLKLLDNESIDCVITDPPYDVNYMAKINALREKDHGTNKHKINSVDAENNNLDFEAIINELFRVLKKNTHLYCFFSEKQSHKIIPLFEKAGFKFVQYLIWVKNRSTPDLTYGHKYMYKHELCGFFQKGWSKLRRQSGQSTVIEHAILGEQLKYLHPTQKPLPVIKRFIENSTDENQVVLDCFMGSGTTAVGCKQLNRQFIGFEIAPEYVEIANNRLQQKTLITGQLF